MMWIVAVFLSVCTFFAEWGMICRERRVRQQLGEGGKKATFHRALFGMSMGALLLAFLIAFSHRVGVTPRQGFAIIVDTSSFGKNTPLTVAKGAISELLDNLGGVPCSLYEINNGAIEKIVPRTIDRLFYNLLLDSLEERDSSVRMPPLYAIQEELRKVSTRIMPWVVVVTADEPEIGGRLDGISCISMHDGKQHFSSWSGGVEQKALSITALSGTIGEYLSRSETPLGDDPVDMWLLVASTGIAFVSYVFWRKHVVAIGTAVLLMGVLHAHSEVETNWELRRAEELAKDGSLESGQEEIEAILSTTTDGVARRRLLFDRSLLAYVEGSDEEAFVWISMESQTSVDVQLEEKINTLKACLFLRLIEQTRGREKSLWKSRLQEWLTSRPNLSHELNDMLELALSSPQLHPDEVVETAKTLLWLDLGTRVPPNLSWPSTVAVNLAGRTKKVVSRKIQALSDEFPAAFTCDIDGSRGADTLVRLRLWYELALTSSPENGVTLLLAEGTNAAQDGISFPFRAPVASSSLAFIEKLLTQLEGRVSPQRRSIVKLLLHDSFANGEKDPSVWYARFVLWSSLQDWDGKMVQPVAEMVCRQVDASLSEKCQRMLARRTVSICPFSVRLSDVTSLSELCDALLVKWYTESPTAALEEMISHLSSQPSGWNERFIRFMGSILEQSPKGNRLAVALAQGVGKEAGEYDLVLIGRLWQVAMTEMTTPMGLAHNLDHLIAGFQEVQSTLSETDEKSLRSLCLLIAVYPQIAEKLASVSFFQNDAKRSQYQGFLDEWVSACRDIQSRIEAPATFRVPRVGVALAQAIEALKQMRALSEEGVTILPSTREAMGGASQQQKAVMVRSEDAVRLFQEMDRSDRKLFEG